MSTPALTAYNPNITLNPQTDATRATRWSYFWKATAVITAVALTALAAFAVGWTALFLEAHLPIVTLMALFSIPPSYQIFASLWARGASCDKQARIAGKIAQHWLALTEPKLEDGCHNFKIPIPKNNTDIYKVAYAHFLYEGHRIGKNKIKIEALKNSFNATSSENVDLLVNGKTEKVNPSSYTIVKADADSPVFKTITSWRAYLPKYEKKVVESRLNQVQLLHFMQNPESKNCLTDTATLRFPDYLTKQLAKEFGDLSADTVVSTKHKNYTYEQIVSADLQTLTNEIFNGTGTE